MIRVAAVVGATLVLLCVIVVMLHQHYSASTVEQQNKGTDTIPKNRVDSTARNAATSKQATFSLTAYRASRWKTNASGKVDYVPYEGHTISLIGRVSGVSGPLLQSQSMTGDYCEAHFVIIGAERIPGKGDISQLSFKYDPNWSDSYRFIVGDKWRFQFSKDGLIVGLEPENEPLFFDPIKNPPGFGPATQNGTSGLKNPS
jgi:hypothetical protein